MTDSREAKVKERAGEPCEKSPTSTTADVPVTAVGQSSETICSGQVFMEALHLSADGKKRWCYHNPPQESCPACWDQKVKAAYAAGREDGIEESIQICLHPAGHCNRNCHRDDAEAIETARSLSSKKEEKS